MAILNLENNPVLDNYVNVLLKFTSAFRDSARMAISTDEITFIKYGHLLLISIFFWLGMECNELVSFD